ncbi:MAG: hypothetical protein EA397_13925 [Deltaproteobacteria bacterium]|nr:MAG: hypothetical protein EA397_13925 [Deltaproteobacteria bacterium]
MLQQNENWPEIAKDLKSLSLTEVAAKYGVPVSEIALAAVGTNLTRDPVRHDTTEKPKGRGAKAAASPKKGKTKSSSSATPADSGDVVMVNGIPCRPNTRDTAIAEHIDQLGKISDPDFGKLVGASPRVVGAFRRKHGIEPYKVPTSAEAGPAKSRKGGKPSKIDAYFDLLGTVPDSQVAELAGVTVNAVSNYRRRRSIPAFDPSADGSSKGPAKSTGRRRSKIEDYRELLGTVPDRVVAKKAGVTLNAVSNYRRRRNIPAFDPSEPPAAGAPKAAAAASLSKVSASPSSGSKVFKVNRTDGSKVYVVAGSFVEAAQRLEGIEDVLGLTLLGDVLA